MEIASASLYNKLEGGQGAVLQQAAVSVLKDTETQPAESLEKLLKSNPSETAQQQLAEGKSLNVRV